MVNELLATWKIHELIWVFKLINKILLFQYSEGIFSAHKRAVTLTLVHNTQPIMLFLTWYNLSQNCPCSRRYKCMNIETIENVNELLATWKNHKPNWVFILINKILLFQYSEDIFSAHKKAVTLTLAHNTQLIMLFPTWYDLSHNSLFSRRKKPVNIETIGIG